MGNSRKELEDKIIEAGNRLQEIPQSVDDLLPLLDQLESLLTRVEQSPSQTMLTALNPAIAALVSKKLLENLDTNVSIGVTTCISEITRITAPEAPYDDDLMKEIFQRIVQSFKKLDDISSNLFPKRVSILETVAKVRSCVVMLDLECDSLILDMFHYFLNTIRDNHPESVVSSMEMIMTLVIEESEDISPDLLSCLLLNVKKDNDDILPPARTLAVKVIKNCASKLKPYLMEAIESIGAPMTAYSNIVATVCQEGSEESLAASKADKSKVPEKEISGVTQQGLYKMESDSHVVVDKSTAPSMSNGTGQVLDGHPIGELTIAKTKSQRSRRPTFSAEEVSDGLRARRVRRPKSDGEEDSSLPAKRGRGRGRGRISREESKPNRLEKSTDTSAAVSSAPRKRGRPSGDRSLRKQKGKDDVPINGNKTEKEVEDFDDLERKPLKDLARRLLLDGGVSRKFRSKLNKDSKPAETTEKPRKKRGRKPKTIVEAATPAKENDDGDVEMKIKDSVSSPRATGEADKDQAASEESSQKRQRKKRSPEEGSEQVRDAIKYDDTLVGVKVKVWWPDDKRFYAGIVESYNPATRKHKVLYNDGDEEELVLKNEILKFRKGTKLGIREKVTSTPESTSETIQRKRKRIGSESSSRKSRLKGSPSERQEVDGSGSTPIGSKRRGRRPKSAEATPGRGAVSRERKSVDSSEPRRRRRLDGGDSSGRGRRRRGRRPKDSAAAEEDTGPANVVKEEKNVDSKTDAEVNGSETVAAEEEAERRKSGKK